MNLLILDSGHNEKVAGKKSPDNSFYEWNFNMLMQNEIKKRSEEHGISVYLTNPSPAGKDEIGLTTRANLANNYWTSKGKPKAIMISLHANAYGSGFNDARGTETYVASNASSTSKNFAKILNTNIYNTMKSIDSAAKDRGVKTSDFTVIYKSNMATCLTEYGFYTNQGDLAILKNRRSDLVEATVKAICEYFAITYKAPTVENQTTVPNGKTYIMVDGVKYEFDSIVKDGTTYVKLRDFEQAAYKVDYINGIAIINKPK